MFILCPFIFFFFNDTATTEIYTLSLHDALPISRRVLRAVVRRPLGTVLRFGPKGETLANGPGRSNSVRSEEHTSELQSRQYLVCRLLLEKKKINKNKYKFRHFYNVQSNSGNKRQ